MKTYYLHLLLLNPRPRLHYRAQIKYGQIRNGQFHDRNDLRHQQVPPAYVRREEARTRSNGHSVAGGRHALGGVEQGRGGEGEANRCQNKDEREHSVRAQGPDQVNEREKGQGDGVKAWRKCRISHEDVQMFIRRT